MIEPVEIPVIEPVEIPGGTWRRWAASLARPGTIGCEEPSRKAKRLDTAAQDTDAVKT